MKLIRLVLGLCALIVNPWAQAEATHYPLTIQSCNRDVTFNEAPKHAVSHDINMTQMMLALGQPIRGHDKSLAGMEKQTALHIMKRRFLLTTHFDFIALRRF